MLNGDFTAIASAACNTSGAISGTVCGQQDQPGALFSGVTGAGEPAAETDDPCGQVFFDRIDDSDENVFDQSRLYDHQQTISLRRLLISDYFAPSELRRADAPVAHRSASMDGAYSGVFGHQFLISNTTVNAFRVTVNRGPHQIAFRCWTTTTSASRPRRCCLNTCA